MATSTSLSSQPNDHVTIYKIISNQQNEGLRDTDYERIKTILNDFNVNARLNDCNNETLMHVAIREQNEKLIKLIYNYGGDFFLRNKFNQTPRDLAVELKLTKFIEFIDENEIIRFVDETFFEENITHENKRNIKSIKLSDESKFDELFLNNNDTENCETFPNLFAFKILNKSENERIIIDKISAQFNDGRPLLVYFQSKPSFFHYKRKISNEFKVANEEMSEEIQAILNQRQIPISLIEKFCKLNDSLMIRILKLRKSIDNLKLTESVLKLSDDLDLFLAVIYEPFTRRTYDFIKFEDMIYRDDDENILKLVIKHDKVDFVSFLIDNYKYYLQYYSPFYVKKLAVDYIANKKMFYYENTLHELIKFDFPFPKNVAEINDARIQIILEDREIFKSNNLEEIKNYVNENKLMRVGYNRENKSALLYAIENKKFNVYSYLLSVGYRIDNPHELKEKIDKLSDAERDKIAAENANIANSDDKNYLSLLTNKFGIFNKYDSKEHYKVYFNEIIKVLKELDSIERCKPLLSFCADVEMLKVTLDFESENVSKIHPSEQGLGVTCPNCLIFVAGQQSHDEIKKTIIHELCHLAMKEFYENHFKPYYLNDCDSCEKFQGITKEILKLVESESQIDNECKRTMSNILVYAKDKQQAEMIARAFEIIVHFNGDEMKIQKLPIAFAELFNFVDEHVVKALSSEELNNRVVIRNFNAYIGLLQNIREANKRLIISENSSNNAKIVEILQNSKKNHLIVSNVPILALINIKSYLNSIQKSLYDAKNIFLDPTQLGNKKKLEDFKNLHKIKSTVIIADISKGCEKNYYSQDRKLIFITSKNKLIESELFLGKYYFDYDKIEINYEWKDLSKESQGRLVEKVNFQGKEFNLSEIINEDLINEKIIDENDFVDLFNEGQIMKINFEVDQFQVFVERQFNKVVEKKEEKIDKIEETEHIDESDDIKKNAISNSKKMHPFQIVLARYKEKLNEQEHLEEAFANSHIDFVTKVENNTKILISDIAGNGKSYILKRISYLLMNKCNRNYIYWVLFIDLRKFLNEFYKWKDQKCFLTFFHAHFGRNLKSYEKNIFEILYNSGKVKILLDGFDEISPKCKDIVIEFIKSIDLNVKSSNIPSSCTSISFHNQLWITTRKHLEFELQDRLEISEIFSLKSLETDEEMTKFLNDYWRSKGVQSDSVEIFKDLAKEVILKFREIKLDDRNLIGKIQQLKILAEICIQNDEIKVESLSNFTMYDIYEKSIEQFIENWKKRPDCKELAKKVDMSYSPSFVINHQHRALLESFDKEIVAKFFSHFAKMWSLEEIEKGGLVTFENDKAYFIHTTYLEFFITNFMMQSLENAVLDSNLLSELFCQIMFVPYLTTTQMFVNDKINSLDLNEDMIEMFTEHFNTKLIDFNILDLSIRQNHENVLKFLIKIIKYIDDDKKKFILISEPEYPLFLSLKHSKINVFNEVLKITSECLTDDEFYELMQKKINTYTVLQSLYNDNVTSEMMNLLIYEMENKIKNKMKNLLLCKGGNYNGLSIQMLLLDTNSDNLDKFEHFFNHHLKCMSLEELIEKSDNDEGSNILHFIARNLNMFVHEKLWERCKIEFQSNRNKLNQLLDKRDKYNNNYFHQLVCEEKSSIEILKFNLIEIEKICDMRNFLFYRGQSWNGLSIQMLLLKTNSENLKKFKYFFNFHLKYMSLEKLIENSDNDEGSNILHFIARNLNMFVHEKLWEQCKIEFQSNTNKLNQLLEKKDKFNDNFLHKLVCEEKSSVEILKFNLTEIEKICDMKDFLLIRGQSWNGLSIQMLLLKTNSDNLKKFKYFFNFHLKYMSLEKLIENSDNDEGSNILHFIARNLNMFVHEKLWEQCKMEFQSNTNKLNQLLEKKDKFNDNFLHKLVCEEKSSVEILKFNLTEIEKICDMRNFLFYKGQSWNGLSIQMLLLKTNSNNLKKFKYFFNFHLKYMSLEELIENSDNDERSNILHFIAWNSNIFVHEKLWERCKIEFQSNTNKLNQLLNKRDKYNNNFLHKLVCKEKSSIEILKFNLTEIENFCGMKNLLLCKGGNYNGLSIQMLLLDTNSNNLDKFEYFFNFHLKYISLKELIENSDNDYGENILHYIAWNINMFVHEKLWERCKIEFQTNESKLYQLLEKRNEFKNNFLHSLVYIQKSSLEILKFNLAKISKYFHNSFEILSSKGSGDNTLLQIALIKGQSFDIFKTLWEFIKDSCSRLDFVKHINELNSDEMNVFYLALKMTEKETNTKAQFIEFIINSLENDLKMSQSEMKSFLRPQVASQKKENILTFIAKNVATIENHEYLWSVLENVFDANEILDLINEVDLNGFNLLGNVIKSKIKRKLNIVQFTWNKIKNYLKTIYEQRIQVEKCVMLHDQFPKERWLIELFNSYLIDLSTHKYAKRKKNLTII